MKATSTVAQFAAVPAPNPNAQRHLRQSGREIYMEALNASYHKRVRLHNAAVQRENRDADRFRRAKRSSEIKATA